MCGGGHLPSKRRALLEPTAKIGGTSGQVGLLDEVRDGEAENFGGAGPVAWKKEVSTGGWGGHPVLGAKGEVVDHRE